MNLPLIIRGHSVLMLVPGGQRLSESYLRLVFSSKIFVRFPTRQAPAHVCRHVREKVSSDTSQRPASADVGLKRDTILR